MAVEIGFDVPFYTRTGWPKLNGKEEFGQMLPLYSDYADGFWDRTLDDMPGDYRKAFIMKEAQISATVATETFTKEELQATTDPTPAQSYPYFTCELGGGMMPSYHRRINMSGREAFPLAVCKLGSGSNLPGYYMYHGGSNPNGSIHTMAECQASPVTNYNDMPHITYDIPTPLGEMGQLNETAFHQTRWLHQFLKDWGEELALTGVDSLSDHYARRGCFEFRNTYVRILQEDGQTSITPLSMKWEGMTFTSQSIQPFAKADNGLYFITIPGMKPVMEIDGKRYAFKLDKPLEVKGKSITVLSPAKARRAYVIDGKMHYAQNDGGILYKGDGESLVEENWVKTNDVALYINKVKEASGLRKIKMGSQKVAEQPSDDDFIQQAAVWSIQLSAEQGPSIKRDGLMTMDIQPSALEMADDYFLCIHYKGDAARLYADGKLVQDNFWNGKPMLVRLSDLVEQQVTGVKTKKVELRILPLGKDYPIYLQSEQRKQLEAAPKGGMIELDGIEVLHRKTEDRN